MEEPRSHSSSYSSSTHDSDEDDIEMLAMDEIPVTPQRIGSAAYPRHDDSDNDSDNEDETSRALLGSEQRTRGRERYFPVGKPIWSHIQNIVVETGPTLFLTTIGITFTGELMDKVPYWKAMRRIDELIMIIPVILNLKGNLEMNLSARLGTAANMGALDSHDTRRSIILGNLALLQVQATVVSFVATCVSFLVGFAVPDQPPPPIPPEEAGLFTERHFYPRKPIRPHPSPDREAAAHGFTEFVMVATTSMTAACLSSIILGSFMCALVVICRKFGRDPDNIAPPIAACLGDLITLCLLGFVSAMYILFINVPVILIIIAVLLFAAGIGWTFVTLKNPHVKPLLTQGWSPLFGAMIISSGTGIVLDLFVSRYQEFGLLAVAISSLPGGVGSILVSRLSTALHAAASALESLPTNKWAENETQPSPKLVMITLLAVTFPIELIFLATLRGIGWLQVPLLFVAFFVLFFCVAVVASLFIAKFLTNFLWSKDLDPDMYALPIHSASMDLIGQLLLVVCFELVAALGGGVRS